MDRMSVTSKLHFLPCAFGDFTSFSWWFHKLDVPRVVVAYRGRGTSEV